MLICAAALMLTGWILVLRGTTETQAAPPASSRWSGAARVVRNRSLLIFLGLVALLQVGAASIFSFYSVYMSEIGASSRLIGLAYSLQGFSELPLYLGAAVILQRLGTAWTLAVAYLAFAARCLLYATIRDPALAALVELSHGLSFSLFLVASVEYVNRLVPSEWRATGQSLLVMAYFGLGSILGNAWTGWLYDRYGVQRMFLINGLWILGIAALTLLLLRRSGRAEARLP
jgi:PPP family 3-phenylpropionic acid transporter